MADVARLAGVSMTTVSRALRKPDIVSPEVRSRIDAAIERLSYRRNLVAGALASARSLTIGVIIPSIINSFFAATIEALEEGMAGSGYQLMLGNTGSSAEAERQLVSSFLAWSPAAMVLTGRRHEGETVRALLTSRIPVLEMWELSDHPIDMIVGFSHPSVGQLASAPIWIGTTEPLIVTPASPRPPCRPDTRRRLKCVCLSVQARSAARTGLRH